MGTWSAVVSVPASGNEMELKDVITFTETTFTDVTQYSYNNKWIDLTKFKGTITVTGNKMSSTITEVGLSLYSSQTGMPTGEINMYKEGSVDIESIFSLSGLPTSYESTFSVSGRKMTLMSDNNADGDYTDENETIVYTKL